MICNLVKLTKFPHDAGNSPLIYLLDHHLHHTDISCRLLKLPHDAGRSPSSMVPLRFISVNGDSVIILAGVVPTGYCVANSGSGPVTFVSLRSIFSNLTSAVRSGMGHSKLVPSKSKSFKYTMSEKNDGIVPLISAPSSLNLSNNGSNPMSFKVPDISHCE